jgi:hypothetical protein
MLTYELTRWLGYFRIRHPQMSLYTKVLPLFIGAALAVLCTVMPKPIVIAGDNGLLAGILQMFANMPGFYVAALAAVATFNKPGMDEPMPKPTPTIEMRVRGRSVDVDLTRRVFLSYLFSYLTTVCLFICLICVLGNALAANIHDATIALQATHLGRALAGLLRLLTFLALFTAIASIFVSTLHGIYFLTERMHQPNE